MNILDNQNRTLLRLFRTITSQSEQLISLICAAVVAIRICFYPTMFDFDLIIYIPVIHWHATNDGFRYTLLS